MQLISAGGDPSCGASQNRLLYLRGDFVDMAELTEENLELELRAILYQPAISDVFWHAPFIPTQTSLPCSAFENIPLTVPQTNLLESCCGGTANHTLPQY